jgi:4-amino-4-deoxy-L-arabinose transferase-like glycosyltransferase
VTENRAIIIGAGPAGPTATIELRRRSGIKPIVIAAAAVRLALLVVSLARTGTSGLITPDTSSYLEPGRNLLLHGRFVADGAPDLLRTPGYPLFFAITSLGGMATTALANVILSVFSVVLVWRLARTVFGDDRTALLAAWIFAFEPTSVANSVSLASDTLFLALFLLSMERLAEFLRRHCLRALAMAGLWLAAATLVRPVTYYLPVALAAGLFLVLVRVPDGLRWKALAVLLISVLPWIAAWQLRNWVETGYRGFSSITEVNLYFANAALVTARVDHRSFVDVRREFGYPDGKNYSEQAYLYEPYLAQHPEQAQWGQGQRLAFMHSAASRIIRAHYGTYLRVSFIALFKTMFSPGTGSFDHLLHPENSNHLDSLIAYAGPAEGALALAKAYPWIAAEKAAFVSVSLGLYLLALRGAFRGGMHSACLWLLLGTSVYFLAVTGIAAGPSGSARYRLPVMPIVCILAAAGVRRTRKIEQ